MNIIRRLIAIVFILILFCPAASKAEDNKSNIVYNENILVDCGCIVADNSGNIYLVNGLFGMIQVYNQQGVYLYSIPVNTKGGSFTISIDNNYLYVAVVRRGTVLTYDNKGYLIDERSDEFASTFKRFREENSQHFISSNGDVYSIVNFFGYIAVSKNTGDSVIKIYSMPIFHWIIKLFVSIVFLFGMSIVPALVFSNKLKKKDKKLEGKLRFIDFYLYIKKIKKDFRYTENNMAERETIRHLITKGFLVVITTINLLGIFSTGYSDVSRELITSMIYILSLFFILDFQIIFYRYRLKDFTQINQ